MAYAGDDESTKTYKETYEWLLDTIKSGSKEFCIKKIYIPEEILNNVDIIMQNRYALNKMFCHTRIQSDLNW